MPRICRRPPVPTKKVDRTLLRSARSAGRAHDQDRPEPLVSWVAPANRNELELLGPTYEKNQLGLGGDVPQQPAADLDDESAGGRGEFVTGTGVEGSPGAQGPPP